MTTTGDLAILDEPIPLPPGAAHCGPTRMTTTAYQRCRRSRARSTTTASAPSNGHSRLGIHGLPLMDHGDWNDGMNRVGAEGQGRKRLAGVVLDCLSYSVRQNSRVARRFTPSGKLAPACRCPPRRRRSKRPGTGPGIAAPISTMEPPWARPRTTRARSTRSPRRGACFLAAADRRCVHARP